MSGVIPPNPRPMGLCPRLPEKGKERNRKHGKVMKIREGKGGDG